MSGPIAAAFERGEEYGRQQAAVEIVRLRDAILETLCDDEPCSRCDRLREALSGEAGKR